MADASRLQPFLHLPIKILMMNMIQSEDKMTKSSVFKGK